MWQQRSLMSQVYSNISTCNLRVIKVFFSLTKRHSYLEESFAFSAARGIRNFPMDCGLTRKVRDGESGELTFSVS